MTAATVDLDEAVAALRAYEMLHDGEKDRSADLSRSPQGEALERVQVRGLSRSSGSTSLLFRGTERNKRRGFHNLYVFARPPGASV